MALVTAALSDRLLDFFEGRAPYDHDGTTDRALRVCADVWRDGLRDCCLGIDPPSVTVITAAESLHARLLLPGGFETFIAQLSLFAADVGGGMLGYTAIAPPLPIVLSANTGIAAADAAAIAAQFTGWMGTGTAINPLGLITPWT